MVTNETSTNESIKCANCGEKLLGNYCYRCGEKALEPSEFTVGHFFRQLFDELTSVDSKLLRSIWLLVSKPGFLTLEYVSGRRIRYVKPLQLFLLINVVYFFAQPLTGFNTYNSTLRLQEHQNTYTNELVSRLVKQRIEKRRSNYQAYEAVYNAKSEDIAKLMIIILVPVFALFTQLLYGRQRRYYYENLVFNLHLFAFQLVLLILPAPLLIELLSRVGSAFNNPHLVNEITLSVFLNGVIVGYIYLAMRRFFQGGKFSALLRALVLGVIFLPVVQVYRFVLFLVTFALT